MADNDSTNIDDWDDDWDNEPEEGFSKQEPEPTPRESRHAPRAERIQPPGYSFDGDDEVGEDELPPVPAEDFASDRAANRARNRRGDGKKERVRPAGAAASPQDEHVPGEEDDELERDEEVKKVQREENRADRRGCGLILLSVLVLFLILGGIVAFMSRGSGDEEASAQQDETSQELLTPSSSSSAPTTEPVATQSSAVEKEVKEKCVAAPGDDKKTVGNSAGDRDSGAGVIQAFDYAYYVDRSGEKARALMSPELKGTTVESLQEAIDKLPEETMHCLWIEETGKDEFSVKLAEYLPDGNGVKEAVHEQKIRTAEVDGKYIITGIMNAE